MKNSKTVIIASFFISLFFWSVILNLVTGALSETKESALIGEISRLQVRDIGAFRHFDYIPAGGFLCEVAYVNAPITAEALLSLKILNGLDHVNVGDAVSYISLKQHPREGGYGVYYGYDGTSLGLDLGSTYFVVNSLKLVGKLDTLNSSSLLDFVLARYNVSQGAFHELVTEAYNKSYALCAFGMSFTHPEHRIAYAIPNIISTFLGVSILADLNALDRIDVTKTVEWITQCKTWEGLFEPFPNATYTPLPPWSSLRTNPFITDARKTGVPYIYAAVGALKALGHLDTLSPQDKQNIKDYLVSCQDNAGPFYMHSDERFDNHARWTEYAIMALHQIDMLGEAEEAVQKTVEYIVRKQILELDRSLPFPQPHPEKAYGLFWLGGSDFLGDANIAVLVLNATNNLDKLNSHTPRSFLSLGSVILFSLIAPGILAIALILRQDNQKRSENIPETNMC